MHIWRKLSSKEFNHPPERPFEIRWDGKRREPRSLYFVPRRAGAIAARVTGEKVPTDLNALADEYLETFYHGMRAKDKSFNADFETEFDASLPKVMLFSKYRTSDLGIWSIMPSYAVESKAKAIKFQEEMRKITNLSHCPYSKCGSRRRRSVKSAIADNGSDPISHQGPKSPTILTTKPYGKRNRSRLSLLAMIIIKFMVGIYGWKVLRGGNGDDFSFANSNKFKNMNTAKTRNRRQRSLWTLLGVLQKGNLEAFAPSGWQLWNDRDLSLRDLPFQRGGVAFFKGPIGGVCR